MPDDSPRAFVHETCGGTTEMPADQVRGRLENPHGYNDWVYCAKCDGYVARRECRWADSGENLGDMANFDPSTLPVELAGHVEQAAEIAGEHGAGAGGGDVRRLLAGHAVGELGILDAEGAAEAAAQLGAR